MIIEQLGTSDPESEEPYSMFPLYKNVPELTARLRFVHNIEPNWEYVANNDTHWEMVNVPI